MQKIIIKEPFKKDKCTRAWMIILVIHHFLNIKNEPLTAHVLLIQ